MCTRDALEMRGTRDARDAGSARDEAAACLRIVLAALSIERRVELDGRAWSRALIDSHPFAWFSLVSQVLATARLDPHACNGEGIVYAVVGHDVLSAMSWEESESVIDIVRTAVEAEVAAVFKETAPGEWAVSLRSKRAVDLVPIVAARGGGGHRHASGYSDTGTADAVVARLVESL